EDLEVRFGDLLVGAGSSLGIDVKRRVALEGKLQGIAFEVEAETGTARGAVGRKASLGARMQEQRGAPEPLGQESPLGGADDVELPPRQGSHLALLRLDLGLELQLARKEHQVGAPEFPARSCRRPTHLLPRAELAREARL